MRDDVFDALMDSDIAPSVPREEYGRTLPFVRTRVPLEDIYRLSVDAEKPAELVLRAARTGPDELAAAMRALDGKPYRGFALLYAAQKGTPARGRRSTPRPRARAGDPGGGSDVSSR